MDILEFYKSTGEPIKCIECKREDFDHVVKSTDGGYTSEAEVCCKNCISVVGYWAYGGYDPDYMFDAEKKLLAKEKYDNCTTCQNKGLRPSHNGSKACKSGSIASGGTKEHCSCDTCF